MQPSDGKLTAEQAQGAILVACYNAHQDGRPLPGYAEIGALAGRSEDWARDMMQTLMLGGILVGVAGRKPTGMTERGKALAQTFLEPGTAIQVAPGAPAGLVGAPVAASRSALTEQLSTRWGIDPGRMFDLVAKTMIHKKASDGDVTKEEVAMVMHVMQQYDLDPVMRQLHAFISEGKLQIMLGYDGWVKEVNKARANGCMGISLVDSQETIKVPGQQTTCPRWVEATLHWLPTMNRLPTVYRAVFEEWFVGNANWKGKPYHRLRMKAYCQAAREGLGIGLADEVDRDQFEMMGNPDARFEAATQARTESIRGRLEAISYDPEPETIVDGEAPDEPQDEPDEPEPQDEPDGDLEAPEPELEDDEPIDDAAIDAQLLKEQIERGELS